MNVVSTIEEIRGLSREQRLQGRTVGFVPTMGYLHEGHASLLRVARKESDFVVLSIFVNPTQFDRAEDLESYPRDLEKDLALAEAEGVDAVFTPTPAEMYPEGYQTSVSVGALAAPLCGATRPGHFRGVATVVTKLFTAVEPDRAFFGEKDFQQLAVIRRLVRDLNLPVEVIGCPIVREKDGLAMSSRNARLTLEDRERSLALHRSIEAVRVALAGGERRVTELERIGQEVLATTEGVRIDYAEIRDALSLESVERVDAPAVYAIAAFVGPVRLIDNTVLVPAEAVDPVRTAGASVQRRHETTQSTPA